MNHVIADPATGTIHAGGGSEWFGPAVWKSGDLGATWTHSSTGLAYPEGETPIKAVWSLAKSWPSLYAGVDPAGLFRSNDGGETWATLPGCGTIRRGPIGIRAEPGSSFTRCCRTRRSTGALGRDSAAGVFHSADGGETWETRNRGTRADFMPEDQRYPEFGQCVHCLVMAPGMPDRLYQQNHCGMYRSDDGGGSWAQHRGRPALEFRLSCGRASARSRNALPGAIQWRHSRALYAGCQGRGVAHADGGATWDAQREVFRRKMPTSACCARPWRRTALNPPASISAPAPEKSMPARTRAKVGRASRVICHLFHPSKRWSSTHERTPR